MVLGVEKWCSRKQLSLVPYALTSEIGVKKLLVVILGVRMDLDVLLVYYFQDTSVAWKFCGRCGMVVRVRGELSN